MFLKPRQIFVIYHCNKKEFCLFLSFSKTKLTKSKHHSEEVFENYRCCKITIL